MFRYKTLIPDKKDFYAWWDASDLSTLFQDAAGTVPVTTIGDPVGLIKDKSGHGKHFSIATDTKRPILQLDDDGQYYLKFDGVDDCLTAPNFDCSVTRECTVITKVLKSTNPASTQMIIEIGNGGFVNSFYVSNRTTGFGIASGGSTALVLDTLPLVTAPFKSVVVSSISNSNPYLVGRQNGVTKINNKTNQGSFNYVNSTLYLCGRNNASLFSNIGIYFIAIRRKKSSLPIIKEIEKYLIRKPQIMYEKILPNDSRILVSDHAGILEQSSSRLRFQRSINNIYGFTDSSPGSRVGISTNARSVKFRVYYNGLASLTAIGDLYVDGAFVKTFTTSSTPNYVEIVQTYSTTATRTYELIWPIGTGMDLIEIGVSEEATIIQQPSARPTNKLQVYGDSITQGFYATDTRLSWPFLLASTENAELINSGYGGQRVTTSDGLNILPCTGIVINIGHNDFEDQRDLSVFKSNFKTFLQNVRTTLPTAKIYVVTPVYTTVSKTIPLSDYRTQINNAVAEIADGNTTLIDGLSIMTNSADRLSDGIHPNDLGNNEIATNLSAIISL